MTAPMPLDTPRTAMTPGQSLCTACGLCCTGLLHKQAKLLDDEVASARALGLDVLDEATPPRFSLPCPRLVGTTCGIYRDRPRVCGNYRCALLKEVENDGVELAEARSRILVARKLAARVKAINTPGLSWLELRALVAPALEPSLGDKVAERLSSNPALRDELKLNMVALMLYLDTHFRNSREGPYLSSQPVATMEPL